MVTAVVLVPLIQKFRDDEALAMLHAGAGVKTKETYVKTGNARTAPSLLPCPTPTKIPGSSKEVPGILRYAVRPGVRD